MKIFLDTNIWLNFLVRDTDQTKVCNVLMREIEKGRFLPYTSSLVLFEVYHVLTSQHLYKLTKSAAIEKLEGIQSIRNLTLIELTHFSQAIELFEQTKINLSDCLIVTQVPKAVVLCTYDKQLWKIKGVTVKTPQECLKSIG